MASNRIRRIAKELADIESDSNSQIFCQPRDGNDGDLTNLQASFMGPPDTPYEGGTYIVDVKVPNEYPFRPPIMKFATKLWHPNVSSQTGAICLDTLSTAWSPVLTIRSVLLSLQSLLCTPEPKDPQDAEVATMLITNPDRFNAKARDWAIHHAGAPHVTQWSKSAASAPFQPPPSTQLSEEEKARRETMKYQGYNKALVDRFVTMGFDIEKVVEAFKFVGIGPNDGASYALDDGFMSDITARLLGEP